MINPGISVEVATQDSQVHINDYWPNEPMLIAQALSAKKSQNADQVDEEDGSFRSSNTKSAEYKKSVDEESKIT